MIYAEDEWADSAGHLPLSGLELEDLMLLHRHWMWANQLRDCLDHELVQKEGDEDGEALLATRTMGFMFVWYAMLWAVIEACLDPEEKRTIDLRGPFRADIDAVADDLRQLRNAVLHVPRKGEYYDKRLVALVQQEDIVAKLRRIHAGFGRLFLEELRNRR